MTNTALINLRCLWCRWILIENLFIFVKCLTPTRAHTIVIPQSHRTATFGDFKFGLVAGGRCVLAFNRRLAVTPKHRSQQIFALLEIIGVNPARRARVQGSGHSQKLYCNRPQCFDRQRLPIKGWSSRLLCQSDDGCVASWRLE